MFSNAELGAILAGLRLLQRARKDLSLSVSIQDIETDFGTFDRLNNQGIDDLCVRLGGNDADYRYARQQEKKRIGNREPNLLIIKIDELPRRLRNALYDEGFQTIGNLDKLSRYRFLGIPNLGKTSLYQLEEYLGRELSDAVPPKVDMSMSHDERLKARRRWLKEN